MHSRILSLGLVAALATLAQAHTSFTTLFINDVNQGDGTCVRQPKDPNTSTNPITDLSSTDMVCGRDGLAPVAFTCSAPAGAKLTFLWRENPDGTAPGAIDKSHKGPAAVYVKAVPGAMADTPAEGGGWAKIWEDGYDPATKRWGTENLMANNGLLSVSLPADLPGGAYLVRAELLALHNAQAGEPQYYVGCAQVFVAGPAGPPLAVPAGREAVIPGYVKAGEKGVTYNLYGGRAGAAYPIPGPPVFVPAAAAPAGAGPAVQTEGRIPDDCLLKNANWCGREVPAYTGEAGCWRAADDCSRQESACYAAAPPSGEANCKVWGRDKCRKVQGSCSGGRKTAGPPDRGVKLQEVFAPVPGPIPPAAKMVFRSRRRLSRA